MMKIIELKGIGEKTAALFGKLNIFHAEDLLTYYPASYDIFKPYERISQLEEGKKAAVYGTIVREPELKHVRKLSIVAAYVLDESGDLMKVSWFNMPYLKKTLRKGTSYVFRGLVARKGASMVMEQPAMYASDVYEQKLLSMQPVYGLTKGLTNKTITKAVREAFKTLPQIREYLPEEVLKQWNLMDRSDAVYEMHFPKDRDTFLEARKRIVFDEFFLFLYTLRQFKEKRAKIENAFLFSSQEMAAKLLQELPYQLTNAQQKVWDEIREDMTSGHTMNRLIQGDVGSGKTILAVLAMVCAAENGYQSALMAPTEVLAQQHFKGIMELFEEHQIPFHPVLLTGSMTAKQKRETYQLIASGEADMVIGTHAVIQDKTVFSNLGLVITDEQHRFGVKQREELGNKGNSPHTIVMSATPIPRTLAIILYGDLDISVIDELPANRLPIKNCVVGTNYRPKVYQFIEKEIASGRQAYVICPMVEESEGMEGENVIDYAKKLRDIFPENVHIEYLHGKMKPVEKNAIMDRFADGDIQILVSTTVVEVGVNVPNATVMMVENAECFGLAGLHQLRGRVGRGQYQSYCIFVSTTKSKKSLERLQILAKSNDGFYIASEDLKSRGPGDIFGIRQSGDLGFQVADIYTDAPLLKAASQTLERLENDEIHFEENEEDTLMNKLSQTVSDYVKSIAL